MKKYLAICPNTILNDNLIFNALNFKDAKDILKSYIKKDTMFQEVKLIELDTMISKQYFIEKM